MKSLCIAPHNWRQIKAKARHTDVRYKVAQGVQHQLHHTCARAINRVATTRIIDQVPTRTRLIPSMVKIIAVVQTA